MSGNNSSTPYTARGGWSCSGWVANHRQDDRLILHRHEDCVTITTKAFWHKYMCRTIPAKGLLRIEYGCDLNSMTTCCMRISPTEPVTVVNWRGQSPFYPIGFGIFSGRRLIGSVMPHVHWLWTPVWTWWVSPSPHKFWLEKANPTSGLRGHCSRLCRSWHWTGSNDPSRSSVAYPGTPYMEASIFQSTMLHHKQTPEYALHNQSITIICVWS